MTTQTFKVIGITTQNDITKVRFANDMVRRVKQFTKGGATRTDFIDLPHEMTKIDALKYMLTCPGFQSADDQFLINDTLEDKIKEAGKGEVKVRAELSLDAIRARGKKADVSASDILEAING